MFKKAHLALPYCLLMILAVTTACSISPSGKGSSGSSSSPEDLEPDPPGSSDGTQVGSLEAFQQTVYPLVREVTCAGCHSTVAAPFFASDDPKAAHEAIIVSSKVDFKNPESSRLVQRLAADSHNCWTQDCQADSVKMLNAIKEWVKLMQFSSDKDSEVTTHALRLTDTIPKESTDVDNRTVIIEAEDGVLTAPMTRTNDGNTSGGQYLQVPNGNGGFFQQPNTNNIGSAIYDVEITEAGTYRLWGLVQSANTDDDSYYVRVDNGNFLTWQTSITGNNWQWDLSTDQNNGGNIHEFNLTPGTHRIEIRRRQDGAKLDMIALTSDLNFDGGTPREETVDVLRFDLQDIIGEPGVYLEIEVSEFDAFSYKFKNPVIISPSTRLTVRNMKIMLNGKYNPQHATYTYIDSEVDPPGSILSSAALIMPLDLGFDVDDISVSFQTLKKK